MASGFNVVDFMDLPGFERCIVRLVLRETTMSYPQLCEAVADMPDDRKMNQSELDTALDNLLSNRWLIRRRHGDQTVYHVNSRQHGTSHNQGIWETLEVEALDHPWSMDLTVQPAEKQLSLMRGGKRILPPHIWDCLTDPPSDAPKPETPVRRTGLMDKLLDDDTPAKSQ